MNLIILFESDFTDSSHSQVILTGRRKEHLISVFRADKGKTLHVGLLNGNVGEGVVESINSKEAVMTVHLLTSPPSPLPITLLLALPRPKSLKKAIEAVTSLGVKTIYLMESWRVEKSFWSSPVLSKETLEEQLILGLEQARDTTLPTINIRRRFKPFIEDEIPSIIKESRALAAHPYGASPCPRGLNTAVTLAVGPEGGFIPYEIELLKKYGFEPVSLGERILRVEYALPALIGRIF